MRKLRLVAVLSALILSSCTGMDAGWKAQRSGDYETALKYAVAELAKNPQDPEVYRLIAATSISRGQYESAVKSAEFASALDGGSERSERLLREAYAARKSWAELCDAGLRAVSAGHPLDEADRAWFEAGYSALAGQGGAYGCLKGLEKLGASVADGERVSAAYAEAIAGQGRNREAFEIEDALSDHRASKLNASKRLYALGEATQARERLSAYVGLGPEGKEHRISEAVSVCEAYHDYALEAELLAESSEGAISVARGIALRRSFDAEGADAVFAANFARPDRDKAQAGADIRRLMDAGYPETAAQAFLTCASCRSDVEMNFEVADLLYGAGQMDAVHEMMTDIGERGSTDGALQVRIFEWYQQRGMPSQALISAERAVKAGVKDEAFLSARLEAYLDSRQIRNFEREASAWIESEEAPAANVRTNVARLEAKRYNWQGILDVLAPAVEADALGREGRSLYIKALNAQKMYPELYEALEKYDPNMDPLKRADYFYAPESEAEYKKCLEKLFAGSTSDKIEAEIASARYALVFKSDAETWRRGYARAIELGGGSSLIYERIVESSRGLDQVEDAIEFAKRWRDLYPQKPKPYSVLGRLYLTAHDTKSAGQAYADYVSLQGGDVKALRECVLEYSRFGESVAGADWAATIAERADHLNSAEHQEVLAEARMMAWQGMRGSADAEPYRQGAIDGYLRAVRLMPEKGLTYADVLSRLDALDAAETAYAAADKKSVTWNAGDRVARAKGLIALKRPDSEIRNAVNTVSGGKDTFAMTDMLEAEQSLGYGENILKALLTDESVATRGKAYDWLVRIAMNSGELSKVGEYSKILEAQAPNNADVRLKIANAMMQVRSYDEAVRHLTFLQTVRPDARDVLDAQMLLARRAPENAGAQALQETAFSAARGRFHRLDWISQNFEKFGDYAHALEYAEQAYYSTTVVNRALQLRLLRLYLKAGKVGQEEGVSRDRGFAGILEDVRQSAAWSVANIRDLAEVAQDAGYTELSQSWFAEAVSHAPSDVSLKQRRLELALASEQDGLIANSLEQAVELPMANVLDPLSKYGAKMDIFDAIDLFAENGEHALAAKALWDVFDDYVESRGIVDARRALETYSDAAWQGVPANRAAVAERLVSLSLMGEDRCAGLGRLNALSDPVIMARLAAQCASGSDAVFAAMRDLRASMRKARRDEYDSSVYRTFVQDGHEALAARYIEMMGIEDSAYARFERRIASGDVLGALREVTETPVAADEVLDVLRVLVAHGYVREGLAYASGEMSRVPDADRAGIAAIAVLEGANDAVFVKSLPGAFSHYEQLDGESIYRVAALSGIEHWLSDTPARSLGRVLEIVMRSAAAHEAERPELIAAVLNAIEQRNTRPSLYVQYAQQAIRHHMYAEAMRGLEPLVAMLPSSDLVYRLISVARAGIGDIQGSIDALEEGARWAVQVPDYWENAREMHRESPLEIRARITQASAEIEPRNASVLVAKVSEALERGDFSGAEENARLALKYGGVSVIHKIADAYEMAGMLAKMPADLADGETSSHLGVQARLALANGDISSSAMLFAEAAQRSFHPIDMYAEAADAYIHEGKWERVEQLASQMMTRYPHAYRPYAYRAAVEISRGQADEAFSDYLEARKRAAETRSWIGILVKAAAEMGNMALLRRIYAHEQTHGTLDEAAWVTAISELFLAKTSSCIEAAKETSELAPAEMGMFIIRELLPNALLAVKDHTDARAMLSRLALCAGDRVAHGHIESIGVL
ncbi:MAG: hypothetical protein IJ165_03065 [Proteobacteria bacterium]|nr:hypothetical protein [Pseudomonadota bacterium]